MTLLNDFSIANKNADLGGQRLRSESERRLDRHLLKARLDRGKEPFNTSLTCPRITVCAAVLAFALYFFPWIGDRSGQGAADDLGRSFQQGTNLAWLLSATRLSVLILTPCIVIAGIVALERRKGFAASLFMFMGASAAALFSILTTVAALSARVPLSSDGGLMALAPVAVSLLLAIAVCAAGVEVERRSEELRMQIQALRQAVDNPYDGEDPHDGDHGPRSDRNNASRVDRDPHSTGAHYAHGNPRTFNYAHRADAVEPRPDATDVKSQIDIERRIEELYSRLRALELNAGAGKPTASPQMRNDPIASSQMRNNPIASSRTRNDPIASSRTQDELPNSPQMPSQSSDSEQASIKSDEPEGTAI